MTHSKGMPESQTPRSDFIDSLRNTGKLGRLMNTRVHLIAAELPVEDARKLVQDPIQDHPDIRELGKEEGGNNG